MLKTSLQFPQDRAPRILCVGAHCDDIEIGCSGTVLHLLEQRPDLQLLWFILSGNQDRQKEAERSAKSLLGDVSGFELAFAGFRDGFLPYDAAKVKDSFEALKSRFHPDLVFTHWEGDRHQDHRFLSELTWSTFRSSLILEYEIPKYDGDLGRPNVYVPLSEAIVEKKIHNILHSFESQRSKPWFDQETFAALHRLRGIENASDCRYAEAFFSRKMCLG